MTFDQYVQQHLKTPFVWGEHDCITFAIGWLNLRTGKDWLADLPEWHTALEARRTIDSVGGLEAIFDKHLTRINPKMARDGDIGKFGATVYLFCASKAVAPDHSGLAFIDRTNVPCAWSY